MKLSLRAQAGIAAASAVLLALPFVGMGLHVDEPFFLDRARDLIHGVRWVPHAWAEYNNNPPMILWLLSAALKLFPGSTAMARVLLLPFDAASAACLLLLFGRFVKRPLAWTLLVVLSPGYALNMGHLMAEKPAMAFSLAGLYALVVGVEEENRRWLVASAFLLSATALSKYVAAAAVYPAAAWYLHRRGVGLRRIGGYFALAGLAPAAYFLGDALNGGIVARGLAATMAGASSGAWSAWPHRTRSILCFFGGLAILPMGWPAVRDWPRRWGLAAALIFLPLFDSAAVRIVDRAFGIWLATGALVAWTYVLRVRRARGRDLWLPWLIAAATAAVSYWSVIARVVMFSLPPLVLGLATAAEADNERWARWAPRTAAGLAAVLTLSLGWVDMRYANAQRELSTQVMARPRAAGSRVWCAASLGLRHYMGAAGAGIIASAEDWNQVHAGDLVVVAKTTSNAAKPPRPVRANVTRLRIDSAVPLRLISGFGGEGGFYSNLSGFLPFSLGWEPVEEFTLVEVL